VEYGKTLEQLSDSQFLKIECNAWGFLGGNLTNGRKLSCILSLQNSGGFGGLEDACWPLVAKFAGLNPAEAFGFFRAKKSPERLPSEGK
jgi:hypothetical protein